MVCVFTSYDQVDIHVIILMYEGTITPSNFPIKFASYFTSEPVSKINLSVWKRYQTRQKRLLDR